MGDLALSHLDKLSAQIGRADLGRDVSRRQSQDMGTRRQPEPQFGFAGAQVDHRVENALVTFHFPSGCFCDL